jgi:hypothetical protein
MMEQRLRHLRLAVFSRPAPPRGRASLMARPCAGGVSSQPSRPLEILPW